MRKMADNKAQLGLDISAYDLWRVGFMRSFKYELSFPDSVFTSRIQDDVLQKYLEWQSDCGRCSNLFVRSAACGCTPRE